ncbi:MAG TPA: hypothetical protein VN848_08215 [Gemmatimonadales bacterium]|nr:hypothetical protein [Gemmatimonadales bacterium]
MTAPTQETPGAVHETIKRLAAIKPGPYRIVSCYLKLEPRDKTRGKYLIKMKNRLRDALATLAREPLDRAVRDAAVADLEAVRRHFEDPGLLPRARGVALFAARPLDLFEVVALPQVHRSRLAVRPLPLIGELVALEAEFGTILAVVCDRAGARFFNVGAFDVVELPGLVGLTTRGGKFHGKQIGGRPGKALGAAGEFNFHNRIREEKHRLYAAVADRIFHLHQQHPISGLVVAGVGVDAAGLLPHLHTYLHDLVFGVVRLNLKDVTPAQVREAALALRDERERAWERAHAEAVTQGLATRWAVNGVEATRAALERGQVRTLLADGYGDDAGIDEAIEEALAERAQVDVLYDERARRAVDGLAALLRFRR